MIHWCPDETAMVMKGVTVVVVGWRFVLFYVWGWLRRMLGRWHK